MRYLCQDCDLWFESSEEGAYLCPHCARLRNAQYTT